MLSTRNLDEVHAPSRARCSTQVWIIKTLEYALFARRIASDTIDLHLQLHALIVYIATAGSDAGRGHTVVVHQEKRPTPLITQDRAQPSSVALERPRFAAAATEDLLLGARR